MPLSPKIPQREFTTMTTSDEYGNPVGRSAVETAYAEWRASNASLLCPRCGGSGDDPVFGSSSRGGRLACFLCGGSGEKDTIADEPTVVQTPRDGVLTGLGHAIESALEDARAALAHTRRLQQFVYATDVEVRLERIIKTLDAVRV